jgi:hypothetical protein
MEMVSVNLPRPRDRRTLTATHFVEIVGQINEVVAAGWEGEDD